MDARHANAVANHPDVRPFLGGDGPIDMSALFSDPYNVAFESEHGAMLLIALGSGVYDVHSMFLPDGQGKEAADLMRDVAQYMFTKTDCIEGRTLVPTENRGADVAARRSGFRPLFETRQGMSGTVFHLSIDRWALGCDAARAVGETFHEQLTAAKQAAGSALEPHDDDPVHDYMVGATALMLQAGNVDKAVKFYNIWAGSAGYGLIAIVRSRPIVIDVRDAIVEVTHDGMEVLLCR
jgi:hypothetical protein